jgi:hypothetical protein
MHANPLNDRPAQTDNSLTETSSVRNSLLTPARRAALDALEREFSELLKVERKVA